MEGVLKFAIGSCQMMNPLINLQHGTRVGSDFQRLLIFPQHGHFQVPNIDTGVCGEVLTVDRNDWLICKMEGPAIYRMNFRCQECEVTNAEGAPERSPKPLTPSISSIRNYQRILLPRNLVEIDKETESRFSMLAIKYRLNSKWHRTGGLTKFVNSNQLNCVLKLQRGGGYQFVELDPERSSPVGRKGSKLSHGRVHHHGSRKFEG